jgi:hypothetical protein
LTGYAASVQIGELSFTETDDEVELGGSSGTVTLSLSKAQTSALPRRAAQIVIDLESSEEDPLPRIFGRAVVQ